MEEIFQPFVTSKTKGTGLGLPIVRKIVENHGGVIKLRSWVGDGAEFIVELPIDQAGNEAQRIMADPNLRPTIPDI